MSRVTERYLQKAAHALRCLRRRRPLIHELTNFVSMNDCANITLAVGAKPVMARALPEVAETAAAADSLLLNLGTLQESTVQSMHAAAAAAVRKGIPVVLDPVGAGGTAWRTETALALVRTYPFAAIRGNMSEIISLAEGKWGINAGVDNGSDRIMTASLAEKLSMTLHTVIAVTGKVDTISDGDRVVQVHNGNPLLPYITGTGCMTTALIASYAAVADPFTAALSGVLTMGIAGEIAGRNCGTAGPGTLRSVLADEIYNLTEERIYAYGKVVIINE